MVSSWPDAMWTDRNNASAVKTTAVPGTAASRDTPATATMRRRREAVGMERSVNRVTLPQTSQLTPNVSVQ